MGRRDGRLVEEMRGRAREYFTDDEMDVTYDSLTGKFYFKKGKSSQSALERQPTNT